MRRPVEDHEVEGWRVHEHAHGFDLLDVWRFPIEVPDDVPLSTFLEFRTELLADFTQERSLAGSLFALRAWLGRIFGWDGEKADAESRGVPFEPVYRDSEEELLEIENTTVHAFMHIGRIEIEGASGKSGRWAPQMGVYVKPKGLLGRSYMAAIAPFRHGIVYPSMMRAVERAWPEYLSRADSTDHGSSGRSSGG
ncbi:MAG: DUF2867 domain-containing protein [Myxococcota bacterium]